MDPREILQAIVVWIGLPAAALIIIVAAARGKGGTIVTTVIGALVALGMTFGDAAVWSSIGTSMASGIQAMLAWTV